MEPIDRLLAEVKAEYEERDRAEALKIAQQQQAKQLQQQQLIAKQRQQQEQQALHWLHQLDPHSDEGFWFEEFAAHYSSKLEAAIDYLQALQAKAESRQQSR
ncbi:MAG: salt stress protein, Slr1339 family [Actinomycetota bacterium]